MLDADTFDALEYAARSLRGIQAPFGGIRLVLCGDFFQVQCVRSFQRRLFFVLCSFSC